MISILGFIALLWFLQRVGSQWIQARREVSAARRASLESISAKEKFLSGMSHKLRTPLNAITSMREFLSLTDLNPEQKEYVDGIRKGAEELLHVTHDMMQHADYLRPVPTVQLVDSKDALAKKQIPSECKVLIVEDNPVNQTITLSHLRRMGCSGDIAPNGAEAVKKNGDHVYDLILMDCQMPGMDGYSAAKEIRRREAGLQHTPIVAVTANALLGDREKCLACGMDDYLSKPFHSTQLQAVVARWVNQKREAMKKQPAARAAVIDEEGPINLHVLRNATDNDPEGMNYLANIYLQNTEVSLERMGQALKKNDAKVLYTTAHGCAGSNACFGALNLAHLLQELETYAQHGDFSYAAPKFDECREEFKRVQSYLYSLPGMKKPR